MRTLGRNVFINIPSYNEKHETKPILINKIFYLKLRSQSLLYLQSSVHGRLVFLQFQPPVQPFSEFHLHLTNCRITLWQFCPQRLVAITSTYPIPLNRLW